MYTVISKRLTSNFPHLQFCSSQPYAEKSNWLGSNSKVYKKGLLLPPQEDVDSLHKNNEAVISL